MSMKPGATNRPVASSWFPPGSTSPIASMRLPATATSARNGSAPVPSSTVPFRITSVGAPLLTGRDRERRRCRACRQAPLGEPLARRARWVSRLHPRQRPRSGDDAARAMEASSRSRRDDVASAFDAAQARRESPPSTLRRPRVRAPAETAALCCEGDFDNTFRSTTERDSSSTTASVNVLATILVAPLARVAAARSAGRTSCHPALGALAATTPEGAAVTRRYSWGLAGLDLICNHKEAK
jgi:hypothetical protein